ncbi:MAG: galactosyldiacylglycerol synthase [Proteobacteria bacterium]|nr:galactosyldiacylglycerol synthase [Pseudomonadota bacterium]
MNTLRLVDTKEVIGSVTDEELDEIVDALTEESDDDQDYYIDADTIEYMEVLDVSPHIIVMLKAALGGKESIEFEWVKA